MTEPTLAELSRAVAEAKGWMSCRDPKCSVRNHWANRHTGEEESDLSFTDPAQLYELEGELQQADWSFEFDAGMWCGRHPEMATRNIYEPGTPGGRARLILRATLEMSHHGA